MTDEAKPAETPGPYRWVEIEGSNCYDVVGPTPTPEPWLTTELYEAQVLVGVKNEAYAAGVASEKARNDAQWEALRQRLKGGDTRIGDAMVRIIDEERGKL